MVGGLAAFFRFTRIGIALRASAENADRASLLGIPVRRVGTVAWAIAGLFAATTIFLRASLVGVPVDGTLGPTVLLYALAAAVIARMESIPMCLGAGIAIGTLDQASVFKTGSNSVAGAIMLVGILGALLVQRTSLSRAQDSGVSTWQAVKEFRPIPAELKDLREIRIAKTVLAVVVGLLFLFAPMIVGDARVGRLAPIPIYAIVAVSLVILTGWAGQISLGQFGIVGIAATVAGGLAANHNIDFFVAMFVGVIAGTLFSIIIGIPALRVQGLYLAVTTLAFAAAVQGFFLRPDYPFGKAFLPDVGKRIGRPQLWQRFDLGTTTEFKIFGNKITLLPDAKFYYLCLVFLGLTLLAARAYRRNRSGRVLIAIRDNGRAAPSYGINLAANRLAAFAISGAIASVGGVLLAYHQGAIDPSSYGIGPSIDIFVITVVGGLTALPGAVLGAVVIQAIRYFGESAIKGLSLLVTGPGLLVVLLFLPGGFAEGMYKVRDNFLRMVANRKAIMVPSLFADRRVEEAEKSAIEDAEHHVEQVGFDALTGRTVTCPVCDEVLSVEDAPDHDHFQTLAKAGR
jgi:branched-chain amino acid transport system permease protein